MTLQMLLVAALAGVSAAPVKLAAPGLSSVNLSKELTDYYSDHLSQQLGLRGLRVTSSAEIGTLIGLERQRQLLGCSDGSSQCIAELAGALGVEGVVTGSVGKFGAAYQLNLKILAAGDGRPLAATSSRVEGEEVVLLDELTRLSGVLAAGLYRSLGRVPEPGLTEEGPGLSRRWWWAPAAAGVLAAGTGGVLRFQAQAQYETLLRGPAGGAELGGLSPQAYADQGRSRQAIGLSLLGVGAVGILAGGLMLALGGESGPAPNVAVVPGAGSFSVVGVFP